jgi:anaerobic magnesium-protoporphyrin IX monomethyl ester cyclase
MRVALIQPPHSLDGSFNCLPTYQLGIGMLALKDYLKQQNHEVRIFHFPWAQLGGQGLDEAFRAVAEYGPGVAAVGMNWLHFSDGALQTARRLKQQIPSCKIVVGGQHASLFSEEIVLKWSSCFDALLHGEAERSLLQLVCSVETTGELDPTIPGVMMASQGASPLVSIPEIVEDLDSLPFFYYDDIWPEFPAEFYGVPEEWEGLAGRQRSRAALDTVRGCCPLDCSYCIASRIGAIQGRPGLAAHSAAWLGEHMEQLSRRGVSSITIQDPFFVLGDGALIALCEEIMSRGLHRKLKTFSIFIEPGSYSRNAMQLLANVAEQVWLEFGIETGSPKVARAMGREDDYDRILQSLVDTRESGIVAMTWWMVGLPDEGVSEIEQTKSFIRMTMQQGAVPAQVTPLILFPQTPLARNADRYAFTVSKRTFEDFSCFSREPMNETGSYPNLLTHISLKQSAEDTLRYVKDIKGTFLSNWSSLHDRYDGTRHAPSVAAAERLVSTRFY